ncbi:DUF2802 domain-containing protein [Psychrosphaera sp. B3R10]|uniref:DUF2802 domain-containing protein n=1 Tax=Psychrosphaera algicola TaxID=3023714 RepID=A0ABT5FBT9_9GAMM|nr:MULTISPECIES: DUF2802 domain-containing protein [unclassified Psychrosphaera]MBU2884074.1 DUF2802 domain-containing protein [Psychrosphaera sp. I2R16]MBU2988204.1 DUF2802 domain-containing protein [Psychrosphaera sp. B3R10]MDC2888313.1 DUF2802 domain-containing protein [Psychrosphaera sp. G1-22]MDO6718413.1 DUF2802 domain-containing protein [Psychrosphaera sp. 1_MG-2023]
MSLPIIAIIILFVAVASLIVALLILSKKIVNQTAKIELMESQALNDKSHVNHLIDDIQTSIQQIPKIIEIQSQQNNEMQSNKQGLLELQETTEKLRNDIQLLQSEGQEDKLYVRAKKLIQLGADIEEIINECGISRTEAELLISLSAKQ